MPQSDIMPRTERILVVEDDEFSQQLIELYLRKAGFDELTVAANGRDALDIAKQQTFDLVLLDLNLPRISGSEVLRRLKKEGMLTDTPVIISSSMGNMDDIVHCMDLGADDFLLKPFNVRLLEGRVSAILEKRRLRQESRAAQQCRARDHQAARMVQVALSGIALRSAGDQLPIEAAAMTLAANEPGGDFHHAFTLPDGSAFFMIGTVAESGTAAALAMARTHALVRRAVDRLVAEGGHVEPHAILAWVNRELCLGSVDLAGSGPLCVAVALLVGTMGGADGAFRLASAGHPDPFLLSGRRGIVTLGCERGRPLGVNVDAVYVGKDWVPEGDEALFMFTKGLADATDISGLTFGENRVKAKLEECVNFRPDLVVTAVEAELRRFIGRVVQDEDITVMALRQGVRAD